MEKLSLSALVNNHAGVLLRVVGLFSRRGYNIQSLTVSETEDPRFSRMTIVSEAAPVTFRQMEKQLLKLEDVVKVIRLEEDRKRARPCKGARAQSRPPRRAAHDFQTRRARQGYRPPHHHRRADRRDRPHRQLH